MAGKSWGNIQARDLCTDVDKLFSAMYKLGFDIYDSQTTFTEVGVTNECVGLIDSNFVLQNGDIILRPGHLHIYMGDGINPAKNFGWGRVYNNYPRYYSFTKINENNGSYSYIINDENDIFLKYTRVYRYVGLRRQYEKRQ